MEPTPPAAFFTEAFDAACAAAVAAAEVRSAACVAKMEAEAAEEYAAAAVNKVGLAVEAVKNATTVEDQHIPESLKNPDVKYVINIKNSLRYAIQEMRRQSSLLRTMKNICSSIPEADGGKIGKVGSHLEHVCKMLEKTSLVCEEDLNNKFPSWDFDEYPSDVDDHPSDVDDLENGYSSEDPEIWEMVFLDQLYEENKESQTLYEHCKAMGYNFEEMYDRTM